MLPVLYQDCSFVLYTHDVFTIVGLLAGLIRPPSPHRAAQRASCAATATTLVNARRPRAGVVHSALIDVMGACGVPACAALAFVALRRDPDDR